MLKKTFVSSAVIAVLLAGTALSCDDPAGPGPDEVAQVLIVGNDRSVLIGGTLQFEGRAATNAAVRVDSAVTWSASRTGVISISSQVTTVGGTKVNLATVTGVAAGGVDLIASAGTKSHSVRISVTAAAAP